MAVHFVLRYRILTFVLLCTASVSQSQWMHVGIDNTIPGRVVSVGTDLFVGTSDKGVFRSTDGGMNWSPVNTGLTTLSCPPLAVINSTLFTGTNVGVFRSTDNGDHWIPVNSGLTDSAVASLAVGPAPGSGTYLYAGTFHGIFRSSDQGESWNFLWDQIELAWTLRVFDSYIFTGDGDFSAYSPDSGSSWSWNPPFAIIDWAFTPNPGTGFTVYSGGSTGIYNGGGVWRSSDSGGVWQHTALQSNNVFSLAVSDTNLFAQCLAGWGDPAVGVYLSTDNGTTWMNVNADLADSGSVAYLSVGGDYLFLGIQNKGLWRRALSEMVTSVEVLPADLPEQYELGQNYPNPFNPTTTIRFRIPATGYVSLTVYDPLGREVSTLVSETLPAGAYTTEWDAAGMTSGVYFYRLRAGSFTETKRLVLVR